ncbi:MarR family winged helix-turn-helix transcriptional regulator [uncultured Microbacterium sp.]|uniref:Transcriptional regulator n=1 Tax=uncultured Microbacterium sp. TaxID=191216 RepID=A0A1Y5NYH4_9MICO|nr:MarR family transcriptional regulator [uncultured Microbacterium sp.]SBS71463.1 Transcriptional regulator [uncultured Microbacterium sp.]
MTENPPSSRAYWYPEDETRALRVGVLEALRMYRAAETAMRRRTQQSMAMGENELLVLRFITRASGRGEQVTPIDLARYLGLSTASITALVDRLERSDHVRRQPHPTDRRKVIITTTSQTEDEIRATLGQMHARMHDATAAVTADDAKVIIGFLERMRAAVDEVDAHAPGVSRRKNARRPADT